MSASNPKVLVSWGELLDKITILQIKLNKLSSPEALHNVGREYETLKREADAALSDNHELISVMSELQAVNEKLWDVEDAIRLKEASRDFGKEFIELARSVYITNDKRAALKRKINMLTNSLLVEEKSYKSY